MNLHFVRAASACLFLAVSQQAAAQWPDFPEAGIPRDKDGKFLPDAPAPRLPDGKPDFSGMWGGGEPTMEPKETPFQPWAAKNFKERADRIGVDDPNQLCAPAGPVQTWSFGNQIVHKTYMLVLLQEILTTFRPIFLDGRPFPKDPFPTYMGYSVGHWEGDTLVIESMGYNDNDKFWLDAAGRPHTEQLRLTEKLRRPTFGRLELEMTIDDPGAYTKKWTIRQTLAYSPDAHMMEYYCDNNQFVEQVKRNADKLPFEAPKFQEGP